MSYTQTEISHESQKQNPAQSAIRHGCRDIESLILECEKIEDYRRLEQSLLSVYAALATGPNNSIRN